MNDEISGYQAVIIILVLIVSFPLSVIMLIQGYNDLGELASMGIAPPIEYILFQLGLVCLEFLVVCAIAGALCGTVLSIWDSMKRKISQKKRCYNAK